MESIILLHKSCTTCKLYLCMKGKEMCNLNFRLAGSPGVDLLPHFVVDSSRAAKDSRVCRRDHRRRRRGGYKCRWLVGCGRVDEEQEQEEEEEDVASGSGDGSRERRRRRRRATIPDGVGKYINEIHGREGEAKMAVT